MRPQDQALRTIVDQHLFAPGARLLVAVSGGADSVALLHILQRLPHPWRLSLRVGHIDHQLRRSSAEDAAFVEARGAHAGIPVTVARRDVAAVCRRHGWSLEDGARRIRYEALREIAHTYSCSRIVLAHTADDQAETVLLRLLRGTGLLGLSAMPYQRTVEEGREDLRIVRPLLDVWRQDLRAYLRHEGLRHREDPSNQDRRFLRNRIRHELLPLLERRYNPKIRTLLAQLAEQSACDYAYLDAAASRQWKRTIRPDGEPTLPANRSLRNGHPPSGARPLAISRERFLRQPKALQRQLFRRAIQTVEGAGALAYRHWLQVERLFRDQPVGTRLELPGGIQARRELSRVVVSQPTPAPQR